MIREYQRMVQNNPVAYCKNVLGVNLWHRQQEIMRAFANPDVRYMSIKSGNGVGKTFMISSLICQYLDTHCPGYVIVSGSSWEGVKKTIWPSLRSLVDSAPVRLGGEMLLTEWRRGNMWGAFCASPDKPENISGMRTKNGVLVVIDEASALTDEVHEAVMGVTSTKGSKVVYSGNPLRAEGPYYDTFSDPSWLNFTISSVEAVEAGKKYNIQGLPDQLWLDDKKKQWGEDSPTYRARILGLFPEDVFDALVKMTWVKGIIVPRIMSPKGHLRLGVDVAGRGDDKTVLVVRDGRSVLHVEDYPETSMTEVVGITKNCMEKFNILSENVYMDSTGLGSGPCDMLWEDGLEINAENFGSSAQDSATFANRRAELFWAVREGFRPDSEENKQYIPKEYSAITDECTKIKYKPNRQGKLLIESKDEIKRRLKRSTDFADAYALTFGGDTGGFNIS